MNSYIGKCKTRKDGIWRLQKEQNAAYINYEELLNEYTYISCFASTLVRHVFENMSLPTIKIVNYDLSFQPIAANLG